MGNLDFSSLLETISELEKSLNFTRSDLAQKDEEIFLQFRMAAIQAFEFTYEISVKMLKRVLESTAASPSELDALSFKDLLRLAAEKQLLDSPAVWVKYRELRNLTAHTYDKKVAQEVYQQLTEFLVGAKQLFQKMSSYAG